MGSWVVRDTHSLVLCQGGRKGWGTLMEEVVHYTVMEEVEVVVCCIGIEGAVMIVLLCWGPDPVPALGCCTCWGGVGRTYGDRVEVSTL